MFHLFPFYCLGKQLYAFFFYQNRYRLFPPKNNTYQFFITKKALIYMHLLIEIVFLIYLYAVFGMNYEIQLHNASTFRPLF